MEDNNMKKRSWKTRALAVALSLLLLCRPEGLAGLTAYAAEDTGSQETTDGSASQDAEVGELKLVYGDEALADADAMVLMLMGDGFAAEDQDKFYEAAEDTAANIMACSPYDEFADVIKIYALGVVSNESGITGENATTVAEVSGDKKDTYFGSSFWTSGSERLLYPSEEGQAKGYALQETYCPDADFIGYLANSTKYGGGGGDFCIASLNDNSLDMMLHEMGHTIAGLADEYYVSNYAGEYANLTAESDPSLVSWSRFIGKNGVGVYAWGNSTSGYYVPSNNCKMQFLSTQDKHYEFCEVCKEEIRKALCKKSNITKLFFQTYADSLLSGDPVDMREYFIIRKGSETTTGDTLGEALTLTYYDAEGNALASAPGEAGDYTVTADFAGNETFDACTQTGEYTIEDPVYITISVDDKEWDGTPAEVTFDTELEYDRYTVEYLGEQYYTSSKIRCYEASMDSGEPETYNVKQYYYNTKDDSISGEVTSTSTAAPSDPADYMVTITLFDEDGAEIASQSAYYSINIAATSIVDNNDYKYYGAQDGCTNQTILVMGEGFTADEQDKFLALAGEFADSILSTEPFKEAQVYFNFTALSCISWESGIGRGSAKDTMFGLYYDDEGTVQNLSAAKSVANYLYYRQNPYTSNVLVIVNDENVTEVSESTNRSWYPSVIYASADEAGMAYAAGTLLNELTGEDLDYIPETEEDKEKLRDELIDTLTLAYAWSPVITSRAYDERYVANGDTAFDLSDTFHLYVYAYSENTGEDVYLEDPEEVPFDLTYYTDVDGKPGEALDGAPSKPGTYHVLAVTANAEYDEDWGCGWVYFERDDDYYDILEGRGWTTYTILQYGDADEDNAVTAEDALKILKSVVKLETLTEQQTVLADVNFDEKITAVDALLVLKYVVGLVKAFEAS